MAEVEMTIPGGEEPSRPGEHPDEKKMLEAQESPNESGWQKPGLEKFQSADQLADAYLALQSKLGERQEAEVATPPEEEEGAEAQSLEIPDSPLDSADGAARLQQFTDEFVANGELSDESMGKLEGMGYPRDLVEAYVRGQQALADQAIGEVHQVVGGSDQYAKMMQWAQRALDDSARDAFNAQVQSGDMQVGKEAVKGLHARYLAAQGSTAPLLEGSRTNGAPANAFRSEAEVVAAMQDPRYMNPAKADPAYVRDVNERLRNSELFTPKKR